MDATVELGLAGARQSGHFKSVWVGERQVTYIMEFRDDGMWNTIAFGSVILVLSFHHGCCWSACLNKEVVGAMREESIRTVMNG